MDKEKIVAELDRLLLEVDRAASASPHDDFSGGVGDGELRMIVTRFLAAIERYSPPGSSYQREAAQSGGWEGARVLAVGGVLQALRHDVADGYLQSFAEELHANVFADFLEMASELVEKHYKDPAAVMAGSVLEEHLRKLAEKHDLPSTTDEGRPLKADRLNADITRAGVFNGLEQKSVTAWLDLRNKAAHGKYSEYDEAQVRMLIDAVRAFLIRHPA